jgi:hypothetical protein
VRDRILGAVEGAEQAQLLALNEEIVPRILEKVRPESRGLLEMHHEAGRDTWIVSASPIELVDPLATALGMRAASAPPRRSSTAATPAASRARSCTARAKRRRSHPGRAARLRPAAVVLLLRLGSDLPMMELVGHPVAVNPDRPLVSVAHQRGWPMVEFARRTKKVVKTTTASAGAAGLATATYLLGRRHGRIAVEAERGRRLLPWR